MWLPEKYPDLNPDGCGPRRLNQPVPPCRCSLGRRQDGRNGDAGLFYLLWHVETAYLLVPQGIGQVSVSQSFQFLEHRPFAERQEEKHNDIQEGYHHHDAHGSWVSGLSEDPPVCPDT